jgi:hypothetical protein
MSKKNVLKIVTVAALLVVVLSGTALASKGIGGGAAPSKKPAAPVVNTNPGAVDTNGEGLVSGKGDNETSDADIHGVITQVMKGTHPDTAAKEKPDPNTSVQSDNGASPPSQEGDDIRMILVEAAEGESTVSAYDKALTRITDETKIVKMKNGVQESASTADLKVGVMVEVVFTGPIAESYPVQVDAGVIIITE